MMVPEASGQACTAGGRLVFHGPAVSLSASNDGEERRCIVQDQMNDAGAQVLGEGFGTSS